MKKYKISDIMFLLLMYMFLFFGILSLILSIYEQFPSIIKIFNEFMNNYTLSEKCTIISGVFLLMFLFCFPIRLVVDCKE